MSLEKVAIPVIGEQSSKDYVTEVISSIRKQLNHKHLRGSRNPRNNKQTED